MQRIGMIIGIRPEAVEEYKKQHAAVWPAVLEMIRACNIRNYSIYLAGDRLFSYFEYCGEDFDADMARMAADPVTQQWWDVVKPLQQPLEGRKAGEWWWVGEEVFHMD